MNRVPTHTPSAPSASAAASPRPSTMPPAATTGTRSPTASTTWGTRANVATLPVWPPASVPWATTRSQPASTAAMAWRTFPHMFTTTSPCSWQRSTTSRGTPSPATNAVAPPLAMSRTLAAMSCGAAVSRSTPKGLAVADRVAAISAFICPWPIVDAPRQPKPPASDTAAARAAVRHAAHAGEHHRVLDLEGVGQAGAQGHGARWCSCLDPPVKAAGRAGRAGTRNRRIPEGVGCAGSTLGGCAADCEPPIAGCSVESRQWRGSNAVPNRHRQRTPGRLLADVRRVNGCYGECDGHVT